MENNNPDSFDGDVSEFNPAFLKMRRLGELQQRLHAYRLNPKGYNDFYQEFNFQLWMRDLSNLYIEIYPKISNTERDEIEKLKNAIEKSMIKFSVIDIIKTSKGKKNNWNFEVWEVFLKWIERYEKILSESADKHGYDSPGKSESSLF